MYMYIVHVILNEPYTFHFTDYYSLKHMRHRTMKYSTAVIYTNEFLELRASRFNYMFKEIRETDYIALKCKKIDMIEQFNKNPDDFTFCSITNIYHLPLIPGYKYVPELKVYIK